MDRQNVQCPTTVRFTDKNKDPVLWMNRANGQCLTFKIHILFLLTPSSATHDLVTPNPHIYVFFCSSSPSSTTYHLVTSNPPICFFLLLFTPFPPPNPQFVSFDIAPPHSLFHPPLSSPKPSICSLFFLSNLPPPPPIKHQSSKLFLSDMNLVNSFDMHQVKWLRS